jgi:hypothetical protein
MPDLRLPPLVVEAFVLLGCYVGNQLQVYSEQHLRRAKASKITKIILCLTIVLALYNMPAILNNN